MKKKVFDLYLILVNSLLALNRPIKNSLVMMTDYFLLVFSFWSSLSIRINDIYLPSEEARILIICAPLLAIPVFYFFGLYQSFIRYANYRNLITLMLAVSIYTFLWFLVVLISGVIDKPYDFLIINWLTTIVFIGSIRYLARWLLSIKTASTKNVIIYGAGSAGLQLESALKYNPEMKVTAFIDDDKTLQGNYLEGLWVYDYLSLENLIKNKQVSEILIAMPSLSKNDKAQLLQNLKKYPVIIRALPDLSDIATGRVSVADLKKIKIEDLLKREVIEPNKKLLEMDINNKNILVTGAGGSIGSELCRQIIHQNPKLLILFEISEHALYLIERELSEKQLDVPILALLGTVTNTSRMQKIFTKYEIDTIYHTAAYKHVPMVQKNTVAGVRCNIFGTQACIDAAVNSNVKSFVFISTDKAVRPTNVMGATKRFAELILQAYANRVLNEKNKNKTRISMVRFGNVLGSSGSVVPLFREQIKPGGPLTVTDPEIIRYFMTIREAAELVIQAGAMGSNGEIFILDMGEPIPVVNLAKDMIRFSGKTVRDDQNPDGDIEIIFTGLRPGEKLYEELLIDEESTPTEHKKIMKANDSTMEWDILHSHLLELDKAIFNDDFERVKLIFLECVSGYQPIK